MKRFFLSALLLSGCTGLSTRLPDISQNDLSREQIFQEKQVFKQMSQHQDRLQRLSHQILSANQDICKKRTPDIGAISHSLKSYSKKLRPAAEREIGANEDPRIVYVRSGSPADKAGLKPGDYLRGPDGKNLVVPSNKLLELLEGNIELTKHRGEISTPISFAANVQCAYPARLKMSSAINAYANGKAIIVTAGMMDFASDDELAMIIGHELAHNEMGHIRKIITNYALSFGATRYARPFESEADYVGLYYTARAGFDLENIEDIWRRLAKTSARPIARAKTHPTFPDRYVRLAAARDEIYAKIKAGEDVVPNMKDKK